MRWAPLSLYSLLCSFVRHSLPHQTSAERRIDPADGQPYTHSDFIHEYGKGEGKRRWKRARLAHHRELLKLAQLSRCVRASVRE